MGRVGHPQLRETSDKTGTEQGKTIFCAARKSEQIELRPLAQAFAICHQTQLAGGLFALKDLTYYQSDRGTRMFSGE
jgi:hypothetical protein